MELTRQRRDALLEVRKELNRQLLELEVRQGVLARKIQELDNQSKERQRQIRKIQDQTNHLNQKIQQHQNQLIGQLRAAHGIGRKDWLKLLMNQEDAPHLARVLAFYGYLSQARSSLIQDLKGEISQLEELERSLNDEMTIKAEIRKQTQLEKTAMSEASLARKQLLKGWDRTLKEQAEQMREDQNLLDQLLESVARDASSENMPATGALAAKGRTARCPPQGPVLARFGSSRISGRWDGILIGGKQGSPVQAVAAGRVVFADWFRGYGLMMILDHGEGVMTLYAFNQALNHARGDMVAAGDMIATLGSSGGRDQPGLYFGVRSQGKPIDPQLWCKGTR